jgi:hypothetical protein
MSKLLKLAAVLVVLPAVAQAAIVGTALGSGAPPAVLGGYAMTAFAPDGSATFPDVTSVTSPIGPVGFSQGMSHRRIGSGWATWSHGYAGDVYYTNGTTSMSATMPAGTGAFILYAEPNPFTPPFDITATADDGTAVTQSVSGQSGATGYGFHITGAGSLASVAVSCATDFAIGEFSIARIPEPATLSLLSLGALALIRRR